MARLTAFEFRKLFVNIHMIAAFIIFSAINVAKIESVYRTQSPLAQSSEMRKAYWALYGSYAGEITKEKIDSLLSLFRPIESKATSRTASTAMDSPGTLTGNWYMDYHMLNWYYFQPMERFYSIRGSALQIVGKSSENAEIYRALGNIFEASKSELIAAIFSGREIRFFAGTEMFQYLIQHDFSVLLVLLLCLHGISPAFSVEKETDMDLLLLPARYGGRKTSAAKAMASAAFSTLACAWFFMLDFIAYAVSFKTLNGASMPIYALKNFVNSPAEMTLGAYAFASSALKTIGVAALSMLFLFVSSFFKRSLLPFAINTAALTVLAHLQDSLAGSSHVLAKAMNPLALAANRELFKKPEFINLFGHPALSAAAALFAAIMSALALALLSVRFSDMNAVLGKRRSRGNSQV
jgi:hypothetical protein